MESACLAMKNIWEPLRSLWGRQSTDSDSFEQQRAKVLAQASIPVVWMLGKTGSGKTSIIRYLTGATDAEVGSGFRPQTRFTSIYAFPDEQAPLIKFLDTRGISEAGYDHADDVRVASEKSHFLIVTVRAMDQSSAELLGIWRSIRREYPERPILLVLTALHDGYPGQPHPDSSSIASSRADVGSDSASDLEDQSPFSDQPTGLGGNPSETMKNCEEYGLDQEMRDWPDGLRRSIAAQRERFSGLFDQSVCVDLTTEDDGFDPVDYRGDTLKRAILDLMPAAYRQSVLCLTHLDQALDDLTKRRCTPLILSHSMLAATAAAFPIPWVDIPAVFAIQALLAKQIAAIYQQPLDKATLTKIMGVVGGAVALQAVLRQGLKLIPYLGMAANAASTFAITYGAGCAWQWYFSELKKGYRPSLDELRGQFNEQLNAGAELWAVPNRTEN